MKNGMLLHVCCGPCATYPIRKLKEDFDLKCFFSNPNIQPKEEYDERSNELKRFLSGEGIEAEWDEYKVDEWRDATSGMESEPEGGRRCRICYEFRLRRTAARAKKMGCAYIATTLSISPHKSTRVINDIGEAAAEEFGLAFWAEDFKKKDGFKLAVDISRKHKMKRQNYCGCEYSRRKE